MRIWEGGHRHRRRRLPACVCVCCFWFDFFVVGPDEFYMQYLAFVRNNMRKGKIFVSEPPNLWQSNYTADSQIVAGFHFHFIHAVEMPSRIFDYVFVHLVEAFF